MRRFPTMTSLALLAIGFAAPAIVDARTARYQAIQAPSSERQMVLYAKPGRARIVSNDGRRLVRLNRGARLTTIADLGDGWVAGGVEHTEGGVRVTFVMEDGAGLHRLPMPWQPHELQIRPILLADERQLRGAAWLAGDHPQRLAVKAAAWDGARWGPVVDVAKPARGSQTGLTGTVLANGDGLLVWSRFDGVDDEIVYSRQYGDGWADPRPVTKGNDVADVTPTVVGHSDGATLAWSRLVDGRYQVQTAQLRGETWGRPQKTGEPGSLFPTFVRNGQGLYLLYRSAELRGWTVRELPTAGRPPQRSAFVGRDTSERPVLSTAKRNGPRLEWRGKSGNAKQSWAIAALSTAKAARVYLAFGDSITTGIGDPTLVGYPPKLERRLKKGLGTDVTVVKSGVPSESALTALSRIDATLAAVPADVFLLMEGTNDVTNTFDGLYSLETAIQAIDTLATRAERRGMEAVHATLIPRPPFAQRDKRNIVTEAFAWKLRELANKRKRRLVDIFEALDPRVVADSFIRFYAEPDPVGHPNADGYVRIAETFADTLLEKDTVPPLPGDYQPGPLVETIKPKAEFVVPIFESIGASGIDLDATYLVLNGRRVATPKGGAHKATLKFQDTEGEIIGCGAELRVQSQDLADPPNAYNRILAFYEVSNRKSLKGDVDHDCRVDGLDLVYFARGFGGEEGLPGYNSLLDFNNDGIVDGEDLAILAGNFGRSSG